MIKLTSNHSGIPILINPAHFMYARPRGLGSIVLMSDGMDFEAKESVDDIEKMLWSYEVAKAEMLGSYL